MTMPGNGKYTEELAEQIAGLVASGTPQRLAAQACGIGEKTFYRWIQEYDNFDRLLKEKRAKAVHERIERIREAGKKGLWTADAWYLERQYPEEFGLKQSQPDIAITVQVRDCTQDTRVQVVTSQPNQAQGLDIRLESQGTCEQLPDLTEDDD